MKQKTPAAGPSWQALSGTTPVLPDQIAQLQARAMDLLRQDKPREAGMAFQQVLAAKPGHPDALNGLGLAFHRLGMPEQAERAFARAAAAAPSRAIFHANHGLALMTLARPAEAAESYRKAVRHDPSPAFEAHYGMALLAAGRAQEAAQAERRAVAKRPDLAEAHAYLGRALVALDRAGEAVPSFEKAVALQPGFLDAHVWLADALAASGAPDRAIDHYRAVMAEKPQHEAAHLGLANVAAGMGNHRLAADNYRAAAYIRPSAPAYAGLARALTALGDSAGALEAARLALRLVPDNRALKDELEAVLGQPLDEAAQAREMSPLEREEAQYRMAIATTVDNPVAQAQLGGALVAMGRHAEAIGHFREALRLRPDYFQAWSEYLFSINYVGDMPVAAMVEEARRWGEAVAARIPAATHHANSPDPDRRLRIGLVSADLRRHPVGFFLEATLAALDPNAVELFAYSNTERPDDLTARFRQLVGTWRDAGELSDVELAAAIRADGIDILVDLSGHTARNRLLAFAEKPAPIAVTWLGYFATTGLAAIDFVLANRWVIPEAEEDQWTERVWRLPDTYLCFTPPGLAVPLARPPALAKGFVTFGSANNINKVNDRTAACWADVLRAVPESRLLLRSRTLGDSRVSEEVRARFARFGIAADRLVLQEAVDDYAVHLARYNEVDIALDPFPYAGGTTTAEALWMGVPVLTLRGDRYVAHMGESILQNMGMPDWIAADPADYAAKAAAFAADLAALTALRQSLRHRFLVSPLANAPAFARHLEAAFRGMWREWCAKQERRSKQAGAAGQD